MELLKQPRFWLLIWGGAGAAFILYVIISASVRPKERSEPSALDHAQELLVGEMEDFVYTFPPRKGSSVAFSHDGSAVSLADFRGKAILVNFWATTCAPCLKELPSLDMLEADLGGRGFEVVAVAADPRGPETAQQFLERLEIKNLKLYADPDLRFAFSVGGADVLPVSILYSADGVEIGRIVGEADWASPEARRLVVSARP